MKFCLAWLTLTLLSFASAQYFSEGWKPGQQVTAEGPASTYVPPNLDDSSTSNANGGGFFDISRILTSGPVSSLFEKVGVNISDKLGAMRQESLWDERVPLITDDNYVSMIVNETLTDEEEKERVWAIVISAQSGRQGGLSKFFDDAFDDSFNRTMIAKDLPHVRWGRIDYLNVTYITTKWAVWQAPMLVILTGRGQTLRFYKPSQLRVRDGAFREFLMQEAWKQTPAWSSVWAPGGEREFILDFFAEWMTKCYNAVNRVPKLILYVVSGSVASFIIGFLHKSPTPKTRVAPTRTPAPVPAPTVPVTRAPASNSSERSSSPKKGSVKQRKSKK